MILTLIGVLLMVVGYILLGYFDGYFNDFVGVAVVVGGFIMTLICVLIIVGAPFEYRHYEIERNSLQETLDYSRSQDAQFREQDGIVLKVMEFNANLASRKYWNTTIWSDWFIDDRFEDLEPIK